MRIGDTVKLTASYLADLKKAGLLWPRDKKPHKLVAFVGKRVWLTEVDGLKRYLHEANMRALKSAKRNSEKRVVFREGDRVQCLTGDAYTAKGVGSVGTVSHTNGPFVYVTVPKHGTAPWFRSALKKLPKDLQPKKRAAKKTAKKNPVKRKITAKERVGEYVVKARTNSATLFYTRDGKFVANDARAMRFFTQALAKAEAQKILPRLPASVKWLTVGNVR